MLVLTENATDVIRSIGDRSETPDGAGLRITTPPDGSEHLVISAAAIPADGDQVVEQEGARLFLEADAAAILDDKVLDAAVTDDGAVQFMLSIQQ